MSAKYFQNSFFKHELSRCTGSNNVILYISAVTTAFSSQLLTNALIYNSVVFDAMPHGYLSAPPGPGMKLADFVKHRR